jgi:hypothetical protein
MMRFTAVQVFEEHDFWVYVPEGFRVEPKPLPPELEKRSEIHWFGNFRLVNELGETPEKICYKYEILALKREDMHGLVFWDGESVVSLSEDFHDFREITSPGGGKAYFRAKLSLTDPACGWR